MIDRGNWKLVRAYLKYRKEVDQLAPSSIRLEESWLRHLLEWANDVSFRNAPKIRPSFPQYVLSARLDGKKKPLSPIYVNKVIRGAKNFFGWLTRHRRGFRAITAEWLDTLKMPRMAIVHQEHEAVTMEEIQAIAVAPVETIRERRIRAAAVFWFLSGIRVGAFVTLPVKAISLSERSVKQWPSLRVRTKFKKHATTYLLDIPDLLKVVSEWDNVVRSILPPDGLWFAPVSPETGDFDPAITKVGTHRHTRARLDLKTWLNRVELPYHSPHKFRHGHAVFALKRSINVSDLKAVSLNLMHSNLQVTDGIYAILSNEDVQGKIAGLTGNLNPNGLRNKDELINSIEEFLMKLKSDR